MNVYVPVSPGLVNGTLRFIGTLSLTTQGIQGSYFSPAHTALLEMFLTWGRGAETGLASLTEIQEHSGGQQCFV